MRTRWLGLSWRHERDGSILADKTEKVDAVPFCRRLRGTSPAGAGSGLVPVVLARDALFQSVHQVDDFGALVFLGCHDFASLDLGVDQLLELLAVAVLIGVEVEVAREPT